MNLDTIFTENFSLGKEIVIPRGAFLKTPDTKDTHIYLVKEGSLKIGFFTENEDKILRFGYENDVITALDSFITEQKSKLYIQAIKKCRLAVVSKSDFMAFAQKSSENLWIYTKILEKLLVDQLEREQDLLLPSPRERYQRVLKRNPKLFQQVPHRHIAVYLGMTEETLSRLKKTLTPIKI
ncbi:Crp/Fnr family transcriptional regulator [Bergeyella zoohelcum]|uniref:Crp/Fnr family transcriptional regulator n=1 Tax=Bergeyella zoohelcum TaxID=1015 RepID=UPI002A9118C9|nr:Crp/Fnr family transcriptional regulator [Bergeyella zoohelcum]MDY6025786.1 Crp/Fnr family transcriptional regulator [Bergeyella zoohelcum]